MKQTILTALWLAVSLSLVFAEAPSLAITAISKLSGIILLVGGFKLYKAYITTKHS